MSADPGTAPDPMTAGGLNTKDLAAASAATQQLTASAKSGGFHLDPAALGDLRKALGDMVTRLGDLQGKTASLGEAPQLGSHPYGQQVAQHVQQGAAPQTPGSATDVLAQFSRLLQDADQALAQASNVYTGHEDQAVDSHRAIKGNA